MSAELSEANSRPPSSSLRHATLISLIVIAAVCRWIPHPLNFTPIGAMAIFGGACYADRRLAFLLPLAALFLGDLPAGFHVLMPAVYASFAINVLLGRWLRSRRTIISTSAITLAGSLQFFFVTNLATWWVYYPRNAAGLLACFDAGIPLFQNTLAGDAVFTGLLFGGLALAEWQLPAVRESALQPITA